METFGLKPISKNALVRCIEQEYCSVDAKKLADEIRKIDFGGVLIGRPEPVVYDDRLLKGQITAEPVPEFDLYCSSAVRAAIFALLGDDVEQRFPCLEFTSCIRLDQAT